MAAGNRTGLIETGFYRSPIGWMEIRAGGDALISILFCDESLVEDKKHDGIIIEAVRQLNCYFQDGSFVFDLPLVSPSTEFQAMIRQAMMRIQPGEVKTYRQMAVSTGNPQASRAVGRAAATNPLMIVVPCHRVVGSGGQLTGYAGGLERKKWLLEHEANGLTFQLK